MHMHDRSIFFERTSSSRLVQSQDFFLSNVCGGIFHFCRNDVQPLFCFLLVNLMNQVLLSDPLNTKYGDLMVVWRYAFQCNHRFAFELGNALLLL